MLNSLLFYFRLAWFCFRLFLNLVGFGVTFLLKKLNKEMFLEVFLLFLILSSMILNLYLFDKRNNPETNVKKVQTFIAPSQKAPTQKIILKEKDIQEKINYYQELDKSKIKNLGLFLNLSQLYETRDLDNSSREYLNRAQEIDPKINKI